MLYRSNSLRPYSNIYIVGSLCDICKSVSIIITLENDVIRMLNLCLGDSVYVSVYGCILLFYCWRCTLGVLTHIYIL